MSRSRRRLSGGSAIIFIASRPDRLNFSRCWRTI
ncbi:hypothetical protein ECFRIK1996_2888, partial [Escherichia coli FRIK1996]